MWSSEDKVDALYRSKRVLRSSVFITHKLEFDSYSYENGYAWFCVDTHRHVARIKRPDDVFIDFSKDKGLECRNVFHQNSNDNNIITLQVSDRILKNTLNLGDVVLMQKVCEHLPNVTVSLENKTTDLRRILLWTTHNDDVFQSLPASAIFVLKKCTLSGAHLSQMALSIHTANEFTIHVSFTEFRQRINQLPPAVIRNFHNNDAIDVMKHIQEYTDYSGWSYDANTVYRFRTETHSGQVYVFFEKEPSEYLLSIKSAEFTEFRDWTQSKFPNKILFE